MQARARVGTTDAAAGTPASLQHGSTGAPQTDAAFAPPTAPTIRRRLQTKTAESLASSTAAGLSAEAPPAHSSTAPTPVRSIASGLGDPIALCLRGLNIQWPFSQLILLGYKKVEARTYPLGYMSIGMAGQEMWIVETPGPSASASVSALVDGAYIAARPAAARIVGTVVFSHSEQYAGRDAFCGDRRAHRIRPGAPTHDWSGDGEMHAWHVASVRKLAVAPPAGSKGMTGFGPRSFDVTFIEPEAAPLAGDTVDGPAQPVQTVARASVTVGGE